MDAANETGTSSPIARTGHPPVRVLFMEQSMDTKLALKLAKIVHETCKDVPHDIGITLAECVEKHNNRPHRDVEEYYE